MMSLITALLEKLYMPPKKNFIHELQAQHQKNTKRLKNRYKTEFMQKKRKAQILWGKSKKF